MDLDNARHSRTERLRGARGAIDDLICFVEMHAAAVDGEDRAQLRRVVEELRPWSVELASAGADGASAVSLAPARLVDALGAIAGAGTVALQVLGARLARPEPWGGPFDEDQEDQGDDVLDD